MELGRGAHSGHRARAVARRHEAAGVRGRGPRPGVPGGCVGGGGGVAGVRHANVAGVADDSLLSPAALTPG